MEMNDLLSDYRRSLPAGEIADELNRQLEAYTRLVVTAPPGAGKSTLLPLTIWQGLAHINGLPKDGKILMLEPRRLAARQIAERMAAMLGEPVGQTVGYRVRFDQCISAATRIEVLTEGILSRMLVDDPTLDGVSVLIFDEFHERNLTTDQALALARASQQIIRPELRILLMSATIDTESLCQALDAPLLESRGRLFPVTIFHEEECTPQSCAALVANCIRRALRQHEGDLLAFLPGQGEITRCMELLQPVLGEQVLLAPLYGQLSPEAQRRALLPSADGRRKVVLATPIAETSLTIQGVRIVVDSGLCRRLQFDPRTALSRLETVRISLDMANQRSGRAGRLSEGVCYRLWSLATEHRMPLCREPEVVEADLAPLLLDVAAWGETDLYQLPWLTPPPRAHVAQASRLLQMLRAIDTDGRLTPHGRQLVKLPCHPRMAQMLICATDASQRALATDIAALLEERDILTSQSEESDLNLRIERLRQQRDVRQESGSQRGVQQESGSQRGVRQEHGGQRGSRTLQVERIAAQYRRMVHLEEADNSLPNPYTTGRLIATAFPERIAQRQERSALRAVSSGGSPGGLRGGLHGETVIYKLSNGETATLDQADDLSGDEWIAVASLDKRIFLAAPLLREDLEPLATWREQICWESKRGEIVARRERRIGALTLDSRPLDLEQHREEVVRVICEAARREGISLFDFNDEVQRLQLRLAALRNWHPEEEWPDLSTPALLACADEWLPLYIGKATNVNALKKLDLKPIIWNLLSYDQQQLADRLAPTHLTVPTGSRIRVDYRQGAEAPVVSVRLQECFGLTDTPRVDEGRRPVLMELLSPGFKPVQLTQDLSSFWQTTYFEVRKELRRRYPKHFWPDNPTEAPATKGVKR